MLFYSTHDVHLVNSINCEALSINSLLIKLFWPFFVNFIQIFCYFSIMLSMELSLSIFWHININLCCTMQSMSLKWNSFNPTERQSSIFLWLFGSPLSHGILYAIFSPVVIQYQSVLDPPLNVAPPTWINVVKFEVLLEHNFFMVWNSSNDSKVASSSPKSLHLL